jgi:hypothetical protein
MLVAFVLLARKDTSLEPFVPARGEERKGKERRN